MISVYPTGLPRRLLYVLLVQTFVYKAASPCNPGAIGYKSFPDVDIQNRNPDIPETHIAASGPFREALEPSSPLLLTLNSTLIREIVYYDRGSDLDNRKLIRPCMDALLRLSRAVYFQWNGNYRIRVIEAYTSRREPIHSKKSLHYEGRAIDMNLVSANPEVATIVRSNETEEIMLRRLATLAFHVAKFSFVQIEEHHLHVSCRRGSNSTLMEEEMRCFPGDSLVWTETGVQRQIKDLKPGDRVLTKSVEGQVEYTDFLMFMHRLPDIVMDDYVFLRTEHNVSLSLSRNHLIFVSSSPLSGFKSVYARNVQVGHYLSVFLDEKLRFQTSRVIEARVARRRGAYAPLTWAGTMAVDNAYVSCYSEVETHVVAHLSFLPIRILTWISGKASGNLLASTSEYHWYPKLLLTYLNGVRLSFFT